MYRRNREGENRRDGSFASVSLIILILLVSILDLISSISSWMNMRVTRDGPRRQAYLVLLDTKKLLMSCYGPVQASE